MRRIVTVLGLLLISDAAAQSPCPGPASRDPSWSPDGSLIVFDSSLGGEPDIWITGSDGQGARPLIKLPTADYYPFFSPDGSRILFFSMDGSESMIRVMNPDGTGLRTLTPEDAFNADPSWSPDGTRIAFYSNRDGNDEIYVMNADGSGQKRLTWTDEAETTPTWSPDGTRLSFISRGADGPEIYTMAPDGSDRQRVTHNKVLDLVARWIPDGSGLVFYQRDQGWDDAEIHTIRPDGTGLKRLTFNRVRDQSPTFSPDGTRIAWASCATGRLDLHVMNADGTGARPLFSGSDPSLEASAAAFLEPLLDGGNFSGSILISKGDSVLLARGFGLADRHAGVPNNPETTFHIASLSKPFTAAAVLRLAEAGQLRLADPVSQWLPSLPERITLHQLLTHTSGLPDINRFPAYRSLAADSIGLDALVRVIADGPPAGDGGTYAYSNSNYNLLAYVIEQVTGETYADAVDRLVVKPMGLAQTGDYVRMPALAAGTVPQGLDEIADPPPFHWSIKTGNGSLVSDTRDLSSFVAALHADRGLASQMFAPQAGDGVGYGWFLGERFGRRVHYINGSSPGYSGYMAHYPGERVSVIVLANSDIALATTIGTNLAAMVFGEDVVQFEPLQVWQEGSAEDGVSGTYTFPGFEVTLTARPDGLYYSGGWPWYESLLIPVGPDEWFHRFFWGTIVVERDAAGAAVGVHWKGSPGFRGQRK